MNYLKFFTLVTVGTLSTFTVSHIIKTPLEVAVLAQNEANEDQKAEADRLSDLCREHFKNDRFELALETCEKSLKAHQETNNRLEMANALFNLGRVSSSLKKYQQAVNYYQQSLKIYQEIGNKLKIASSLNNLGVVYNSLEEYQQAINYLQQSLKIYQELNAKSDIASSSYNLGVIYTHVGQYHEAIKYLQQSLEIYRVSNDNSDTANSLFYLGIAHISIREYQQAINYYQQSLEIRKKIGDRSGIADSLGNLGIVYRSIGQYQKAIDHLEQSLAIEQEINDRSDIAKSLFSLGIIYRSIGQYQQAIDHLEQSLAIEQEINDRFGEANSLVSLGSTYLSLGEYQKAIDHLEQSLVIYREIKNSFNVMYSLINLSVAYNSLGEYEKAINYSEQSLSIGKEIEDPSVISASISNLGNAYNSLGEYQKAIDYFEQSLVIDREVGDLNGTAISLSNLGGVYLSLEKYQKANEHFQQSLIIFREIGNSPGTAHSLDALGFTLSKQKQPELAIAFYKESVNITESIREDIKGLPQEQQESYVITIEDRYRNLAELLLQQDRVLEAQQVLDLLKVQELDDYLRGVRGTGEQLTILQPEKEILAKYNALQNSVIELGRELTQLREIPETERTPAQKQRIAELVNLEEEINIDFNQFIDSPEILALLDQLSRTAQRQNVDLADFDALRDDLRQLGNAVMLYPLILEDRLELVITTPDSPPLRRTIPVKREELNRTIVEFRQALQNPNSDAQKPAQQLYEWLIKPLEADLEQAQAQNIIYAPDGQLRYIPLTALHDGNQWLIQKYRVNNITAKSFTEFTSQPPTQPQVLAGAFADETITYPAKIGERDVDFQGLPFAGVEVENLAATLSNTTKLIDKDFSLIAVKPKIGDHSIIHFATHAAFVTGKPKDSFILFGNGELASLIDIGGWTLNNVDLVVLSACETGVGGEFGNGEEILGLGYQFQNRGARAVMASLWQVSDGGTQALMNAFYSALSQGNLSKLEALQKAQIALITDDYSAVEGERGIIELVSDSSGLPPSVSDNLDHPYYWAAFILIGNGL